jgi:peptidoglycan/LPS O-acetylase OafA/YrhL
MNGAKVHELDVLRALSVLTIVVVHCLGYVFPGGYTGSMATQVNLLVKSAVGVLFFASGAAIGLNYPVLSCRAEVMSFIWRRFIRIYPLYLLALALFVLLGLVRGGPVTVLAHALMLQTQLTPLTGPVAQTLWFVSVIFFFYLLYPLIVRKGPSMGVFALRVAIAVVLMALVHLSLNVGDTRLILWFPFFCVGVATTRYRSVMTAFASAPAAILALVVTAMVYIPAGNAVLMRVSVFANRPLAIAGMIAVLALPLSWQLARVIAPSPAMPTIGWLAYGSYAIYLMHRPVLLMMGRWWEPVPLWQRVLYFEVLGVFVVVAVSLLLQTTSDRILFPRKKRTAPQA